MITSRELAHISVPETIPDQESLEQQLDLLNAVQAENGRVLRRHRMHEMAYSRLNCRDQLRVDRAGSLARPVIYAASRGEDTTEIGIGFKFTEVGTWQDRTDQGLKVWAPVSTLRGGRNVPTAYRTTHNTRGFNTEWEACLVFTMAHRLWNMREVDGRLPHLDETLSTVFDPCLGRS